jgi:RimJ/RimL family protein N-acetyltransferase
MSAGSSITKLLCASRVSNRAISETLRDGQRVGIRSQRPLDRKDLEAALARMSDESLHRRFFGARRHYFVDIDFVNHVALVAVVQETGKQTIVGAARYVVVRPGQAEVAFGVVDQNQGQGLGGALMRELAAVAHQGGINELVADVLGSNLAMLKVFEKSGLQVVTKREGPIVHVTLEVAYV